MKVCYILSYKSPNYIRTRTLVKALKQIENIELYQARNTSKGTIRYIQTLLKLLKIRLRHNPDLYMLGFRGHEIFWPVRLLTLGKPLVFDEMMSPAAALKEENKGGLIGRIISPFIYILEKSIMAASNKVLTDTKSHKEFLTKFFSLRETKVDYVYVSTDEETFTSDLNTNDTNSNTKFRVFFYSSFQPLHGVNIITKAAKRLEDLSIEITIVGGKGKRKEEFLDLIQELNIENINYKEWINYDELPKYISESDVCLGGPFGGTKQGHRVITGKTFQFLSMAKPTIIGSTDQDHLFTDKENVIICEQGSPESLSEAIRWTYEHKKELKKIGTNAKKLYNEKFSNKQIAIQLEMILKNLQ